MGMAVDTAGELGFPYWNPIRRRFPPDSPFFASGNVERELLAKQVLLESESVAVMLFLRNTLHDQFYNQRAILVYCLGTHLMVRLYT